MPRTSNVEGITNGHWERAEPRSAWLLLLARMGVAELRMLSDRARIGNEHSEQGTEHRSKSETAH